MTSEEPSLWRLCLEIIQANEDRERIRLAREFLKECDFDSIDFSNVIHGFFEIALSSAFEAAYKLEDFDSALDFSDAAAGVATRMDDNWVVRSRVANNQGLARLELGQFVAAAAFFHQALDDLRHGDDLMGLENVIRANLDALEHLRGHGVDSAQESSTHGWNAVVRSSHSINNDALRLMDAGRVDDALTEFTRALALCDEGDVIARANILSNIAGVERQLGNPMRARKILEEALELCRGAGYQGQILAGILHMRCELRLSAGEDVAAVAIDCKEAWDVIRQIAPRSRHSLLILTTLARVRIIQNDWIRARSILERAMSLYDEMRAQTGVTEAELQGFFSIVRGIAELRLCLAVHDGDNSTAYRILLKAKTRFWTERLAKAPLQSEAEGNLATQMVIAGEFARLLGFNGTLLEFFVAHNAVFIFVMHNQYLASYRRDIEETKLARMVEQIRERLLLGLPCVEETNALSCALLDRVDFDWERHRFIMIAPDGPLWRIPLEILIPASAGKPIYELGAVATVPSASALRYMRDHRRPARQNRVVVVAHTVTGEAGALAHPAEEIRMVRDAFPEGEVVEFGEHDDATARATPSNVLGALADASHIHFLAHAASGAESSEAHLVLAGLAEGDAYLTVSEIQSLQLSAEVVVLAACESSLGRASPGEGLASLARAFLLAGTRCVIASYWEMRDDSLRTLLGYYYAGLAGGKGVAKAFYEAKRAYSEVFGRDDTWAGVTLIGDADDLVDAFNVSHLVERDKQELKHVG